MERTPQDLWVKTRADSIGPKGEKMARIWEEVVEEGIDPIHNARVGAACTLGSSSEIAANDGERPLRFSCGVEEALTSLP